MNELDEIPYEKMTLQDYEDCWLIHPIDDSDCKDCLNIKKCKSLRK